MSGILLNNVNVDTTSGPLKTDGGNKVIVVRGDDFGGGTVEIQVKSNNDSENRFLTLDNGSFTVDGTLLLSATKSGLTYRAVLSGATSPVNIFAELV